MREAMSLRRLCAVLSIGLLFVAAPAAAKRVRYHEVQEDLLVLGDPADAFISAARRVAPKSGFFDLVGHGNAVTLGVHRPGGWRNYDAKHLARFLRHTGWNGKDTIRFVSCHVGCGLNSLGEQLANELNVPVLVPKGYLWAYPDGAIDVQHWLGGPRMIGRARYAYFVPGRGDVTLPGNRLFRNRAVPAHR